MLRQTPLNYAFYNVIVAKSCCDQHRQYSALHFSFKSTQSRSASVAGGSKHGFAGESRKEGTPP